MGHDLGAVADLAGLLAFELVAATDKQKQVDAIVAELEKTTLGYTDLKLPPSGHWRVALKALETLRAELGGPVHAKVVLGPIIPGGAPVLEHDLTHRTDGFSAFGSVWPAFDELCPAGTKVVATEPITVTQWGSAQGGESVHATGASGLKYWLGHVTRRKPVGSKIARGSIVCYTSGEVEVTHCHFAVDGIPLLGHDFAHHRDYSHGAPIIATQLHAVGIPTK